MLGRIDWANQKKLHHDQDDQELTTDEPNQCLLVWEGQIKDRQFRGFRFKTFPIESMVKSFLQDLGTLHYWEAARNYVQEGY